MHRFCTKMIKIMNKPLKSETYFLQLFMYKLYLIHIVPGEIQKNMKDMVIKAEKLSTYLTKCQPLNKVKRPVPMKLQVLY